MLIERTVGTMNIKYITSYVFWVNIIGSILEPVVYCFKLISDSQARSWTSDPVLQFTKLRMSWYWVNFVMICNSGHMHFFWKLSRMPLNPAFEWKAPKTIVQGHDHWYSLSYDNACACLVCIFLCHMKIQTSCRTQAVAYILLQLNSIINAWLQIQWASFYIKCSWGKIVWNAYIEYINTQIFHWSAVSDEASCKEFGLSVLAL